MPFFALGERKGGWGYWAFSVARYLALEVAVQFFGRRQGAYPGVGCRVATVEGITVERPTVVYCRENT